MIVGASQLCATHKLITDVISQQEGSRVDQWAPPEDRSPAHQVIWQRQTSMKFRYFEITIPAWLRRLAIK